MLQQIRDCVLLCAEQALANAQRMPQTTEHAPVERPARRRWIFGPAVRFEQCVHLRFLYTILDEYQGAGKLAKVPGMVDRRKTFAADHAADEVVFVERKILAEVEAWDRRQGQP